ncbi:hypothetical protein A1O1_07698 [Capronia coronata CBS 617.96]|uniref:Uncharacterized protein n=1 Tax=Capronia coronata CBS 617.96 TaxID=1182541 RepID=W9XN30_9EURO|nr:uncharacterized protein A1O1_07698 [Capronia coronata CBS 617.96]EXJ81633.1 hypothetical protein A1O1_07698 [Capronia coronata CBS 617.96]
MAIRDITVEEIDTMSSWAAERLHVDKPDFEWTRSVAQTYRQFGHHDEAIQAYGRATELQQDHWSIDYGLGEWSKTAELLENIIRRVEASEDKGSSPAEVITKIRFWLAWAWVQVDQHEKAIAVYDGLLATNPGDYASILRKIVALRRQERYEDIIEFLQQLQRDKDPAYGISRLSMTFHSNVYAMALHNGVVLAGKKTGNLPFVQAAYRSAIEQAMDQEYLPMEPHTKARYRVALTSELADILYKYPQDPEDQEEALELWETCLADADDIGLAPARLSIAKSLSTVYAEQLHQVGSDTKQTDEILDRLLQLSGETTADLAADFGGAFVSTVDTRLLVGRYYSKVGMKKEAEDCLRSHIRIGIDLLSDDDPSNDWQGYLRLASTLMYYGDKENALAAWSLIGPNEFNKRKDVDGLDKANDSTGGNASGRKQEDDDITLKQEMNKGVSSDGQQEPDQPSPLARANKTLRRIKGPLPPYGCDGGSCEHWWTYANDIYVCMDCLDMMFAKPCYELLLKDALELRTCNPTHDFLHIPSWDEHEAEQRGPKHVRQAGKIIPVDERIKEIRRDWQLEGDQTR